MSETLSQDPESIGTGYGLAQTYPANSATPNSTVQDAPNSNLPPFSTFSAEMDANSGYSSDRLFGDTRLLDISSWDYYGETRLLERTENGLTAISSQPQYRPWESKPLDSTSQESLRQSFTSTTPITTFADAFAQSNMPKLPSFQSQFQTFNETPVTTSEPTTLTTLTNLTPVSPNSASPGSHNLTTLNTNFHTLSAVNSRNYPLVPAPIQAREIPSIQQQFLDERHIQLYTHPTTSLTTLGNTLHSASIFPAQNGTIIQNSQLITPPTVVTVLKSEPGNMSELKIGHSLTNLQDTGIKIQNVSLHPTQFQNPMSTVLDNNVLYNGLEKKMNGMNSVIDSPTRNDFRKKERRKIRANSMESSAESDGASSNMDMGSENSGQVASISSTAGFKGHPLSGSGGLDHDDISAGNSDKQVKKKRKRCGECIGCQRKDNCGDCAPCRNDKSHQICKQRRCEKLTEKKLYGEDGFVRGESRRGRGKGRSAGSYRGRKPSGPVSMSSNNSQEVNPPPPPSRPSPQPVHMIKPEQTTQSQTMTAVPFYADPNRFASPVWQAETAQGWPQGQFIQQISATPQVPLEGYTQQYSNGIYQTTYQQPGFETNTFYTTGPVQVVTNASRPSSVTDQAQLTPRPNSTYSHTSSPLSSQQQQNNQRSQYQQEYVSNNQSYVSPASTPSGSVENQQSGGISRPGSVNSSVVVSTNGSNFQQNNSGFIPISSNSNFSPNSNHNSNFVNSSISTNSGNEMPGYLPVSSQPQLASHNYNGGYPGSGCGNENLISNEEQHHWNTNNHQWKHNSESAKSSESEMRNYGNNSPISHRQSNEQQIVESPQKREIDSQYGQIDRIDLNTRIKTMILNKQQQTESKDELQNDNQCKTGHFLSYSHHRCPNNYISNGGGLCNESFSSTSKKESIKVDNYSIFSSFDKNLNKNNKKYSSSTPVKKQNVNTKAKNKNEGIEYSSSETDSIFSTPEKASDSICTDAENFSDSPGSLNTKHGENLPSCECFPPNVVPPESGTYYTHLGCSHNLIELRENFEEKTGLSGSSIRIEKICFTGKEGKTPQGCPLAKWIIRRTNLEEKYLLVVKHRRGHFCSSAFIVVCIVVWEGLVQGEADQIYTLLCYKLNKFGTPTARRCGTNDTKTCACQGLNPDKCGASFSFGCSWSMFYNGCKYARSKNARKFKLTEQLEETELEEKLQYLANFISPLYQKLAPKSFKNQCEFEEIASECRLGSKPGRPFSGVTACLDFCAHSHKDLHNMNNGCTVVVTLTKRQDRDQYKPEDEQLHVLPLYTIDKTDEFGSEEKQKEKILNGSIEQLQKFQFEVRVRNKSQESNCRRKRKNTIHLKKREYSKNNNNLVEGPQHLQSKIEIENELQSNKVTSTVFVGSNSAKATKVDINETSLWNNIKPYNNLNDVNSFSYHDNHILKPQSRNYDVYSTPSNQQFHYENDFSRTAAGTHNRIENKNDKSNFSSHISSNTNISAFFPNFTTSTDKESENKYVNSFINKNIPISHSFYSTFETNNSNYLTKDESSHNQIINELKKEEIIYRKKSSNVFLNYITSEYNNHSNYLPWEVDINNKVHNNEEFFFTPDPYILRNPFDDLQSHCSSNYSFLNMNCDSNFQEKLCSHEKLNCIGFTTEIIDNTESFRDSQIGGVAIALSHGSVLFECAKHELHATTALKDPDRKNPTRISLVFYQHRNMNKSKHGWDEYEEKVKLRKMNTLKTAEKNNLSWELESTLYKKIKNDDFYSYESTGDVFCRALPNKAVTKLFPIYPYTMTSTLKNVSTND